VAKEILPPVPGPGLLQCRDGQLGVVARRQAPADDIPAVQIHGGGEISPSLASLDIGRVGDPVLTRSAWGGLGGKDVGVVAEVVPAVGRPWLERALRHLPDDSPPAMEKPPGPQGQPHPGISVDASVLAAYPLDSLA